MKKESNDAPISARAGNQNARKHGFYSKVLDAAEQAEYDRAIEIDGLDEEIAMMRVKIMTLVKSNPENVRLLTQAVNTLVRMVKMKYQLEQSDHESAGAKVRAILEGIALPLGLGIGSAFRK